LQAPSTTASNGDHRRIMVVEDEPALREYIVIMLTENGFQVVEADCGRTALEMWRNVEPKPDLLFTDMVMPNGVDGPMLAAELLRRDPHLRVVYMSGYSNEAIHNQKLLNHEINFLAKPFSPDRMLTIIRNALETNAPSVTLARAGQ
jgi:two-component system cell cycle sensor histidine kinase/response regulator CckA